MLARRQCHSQGFWAGISGNMKTLSKQCWGCRGFADTSSKPALRSPIPLCRYDRSSLGITGELAASALPLASLHAFPLRNRDPGVYLPAASAFAHGAAVDRDAAWG